MVVADVFDAGVEESAIAHVGSCSAHPSPVAQETEQQEVGGDGYQSKKSRVAYQSFHVSELKIDERHFVGDHECAYHKKQGNVAGPPQETVAGLAGKFVFAVPVEPFHDGLLPS